MFGDITLFEVTIHTVIAIAIVLPCGWLHEYLHCVAARKLGYKVTSMNLRRNETDIKISPDDPNVKKIAKAPYYILTPIGIILLVVGIALNILGVGIAGVTILFLHGLSFWFEGKEKENEKVECES